MKVVAVTSCATGIAHTYMAAEAIMKVCKERGYKCKVEKQGALGLEDKLRDRDIKEADLIVFANDVGLTKAERFEPYKDEGFGEATGDLHSNHTKTRSSRQNHTK